MLAVTGNLYPYGPVDGPMVEGMPDAAPGTKAQIRARMTAEAFDLHRGRADPSGRGARLGLHGRSARRRTRTFRAWSRRPCEGKNVRVIGSADQPHTWTDVVDMGRALVAVAGAESAHGRVWHAPSNPPRTQAEAVNDVLASVGRAPVRVRAFPPLVLRAAGLLDGQLRELRETEYQFTRPYVMDSSAITAELGLAPTPWDEVCRRTAG